MKKPNTPLAIALTTALGTMGLAHATDNPFEMQSLSQGYNVAEASTKGAEGKCGEGKCGEGKCGGAKDSKKAKEGQCGGDKAKDGSAKKTKEGKCGEGKCGEGKCGGNK